MIYATKAIILNVTANICIAETTLLPLLSFFISFDC